MSFLGHTMLISSFQSRCFMAATTSIGRTGRNKLGFVPVMANAGDCIIEDLIMPNRLACCHANVRRDPQIT